MASRDRRRVQQVGEVARLVLGVALARSRACGRRRRPRADVGRLEPSGISRQTTLCGLNVYGPTFHSDHRLAGLVAAQARPAFEADGWSARGRRA